MLSNLAMWAIILGFVIPPVESAVLQFRWPTQVQALIGLAVSAVAGAGNAYFNGDLNGKSFVQSALLVFVSTITAYHGWWKPSGISPGIESATTPTKNSPGAIVVTTAAPAPPPTVMP